ncbi:TB2/DP1, HVA22 family-domain-containing protein [Leptodontidium sp. 2 PMI_412]|nr:TB2/DP1, HVA22 family-domain-containing protein [Leptodontidium sp. MPI-SDFR-AT-0119]KAH9216622.1 TB2/DP1, HVA22 family-domain-containing protein [Leptodontidium sp. 2 PMI_412]
MFFSTFANLLSSIPTFLFPVFASYKALKTSDPALLAPWLMYWVVLACALFFESWTGFILVWVPFYAWIRLGFLLYLILPQTQGAKVLYQSHVHPWLQTNERSIDDFISSAHDRAKAAGYTYLKQAVELIKQHLLGLPPKEPTPPSTPSTFSYAQSLIARFNLPSARPAFPAMPATSTATDFYSLLASAVSAATSRDPTSASSQPRDLSNSGMLIPPSVTGEERLSFISAQRERLAILLSALDKEANTLQGQSVKPSTPRQVPSMFFDGSSGSEEEERPISSMGGLSTRKSEADFEKIEAESGAEEAETVRRQVKRSSGSASWMPWSWGAKTDGATDTEMSGTHTVVEDKGKSSSVDA